MSNKCTIGLERSYINLVHPLHTLMLYTYIWKDSKLHIYNKVYIHTFDKQKWWEKRGIECKCMISFWIQSIISYHPNLLVWCIYFCTIPNTIKLFSSVKLSEPNNKFAIGVYGVMFISSKGYYPSSSQCFATNMVNYI